MPERPHNLQVPSVPPEHGSSVASSAADADAPGDVDRLLFKNLVEMVPLVESLMDRRANSSFTRRASMVHTPAPSQHRKGADFSGRKTAETVSAKKRRDAGENISSQGAPDDYSIFSSGAGAGSIQKDNEEMILLREQVTDLQKKLLEKEEALKSAEVLVSQMNTAQISVAELKHQVAEKDLLIKSTSSQLYNAKIELANKQATLEKLEWKAKMSNRKVEELQGNADSMEFEITALMHLFEELSKNDLAAYADVNIDYFDTFEHLPHIDDIDVEKMENARTAYMAAIAAAKENPNEESIGAAAEARRRLQAFVL